jgi:hypothetical protein
MRVEGIRKSHDKPTAGYTVQLYNIQTRQIIRNSGKSPENEPGSVCGSRQSRFVPFPFLPKIGEKSGLRNIDF